MGEEPKKENHETLYYKRSSDFKKFEKGIEVVVVTTEAQLIEAGVDKEAAKAVMKNLHPSIDKLHPEYLIVVKNSADKAQRVFKMEYMARVDVEEGGKKFATGNFGTIKETVDLSEPNKTVRMDAQIELGKPKSTVANPILAVGKLYTPLQLEQADVDTIQKAILENKTGMAPGIGQNGVTVAGHAPPLYTPAVQPIGPHKNIRG